MQQWIAARALRALALGISLLVPPAMLSATQAVPRIALPTSAIDLGVMRAGQEVDAIFEIRNGGDAPLLILDVEPGCSCTATDYDEEIAPGGSGRLRARLMTAELSGPVTKGIVVTTNDPATGKVVLTLTATVLTNFELLPQPVVFMRAEPGGAVIGRLLVRKQNDVEGAVEISNLRASRDIFEARATELSRPRPRGGGIPAASAGDWLIEVEFRSGVTRFGRIRERLRFDTGLAAQPFIEVPIESSLDAPVVFSVETLKLNRSGDGRWRASCFASMQQGVDPASLRVDKKPSALQVTTTAVGERLVRVDLEAGSQIADATVEFLVDKIRVSLPVHANP